jgi:hypothetical protein
VVVGVLTRMGFSKGRCTVKNVLIFDNDLGFIFWLGGIIIAANYQPWPACSLSDASELVEEAAVPIDLLIVNPSLPGVSELIALLRRSQKKLKVIALGAEGNLKLAGVNSWRQKPRTALEKSARREWLEAMKNMFLRHTRAA